MDLQIWTVHLPLQLFYMVRAAALSQLNHEDWLFRPCALEPGVRRCMYPCHVPLSRII